MKQATSGQPLLDVEALTVRFRSRAGLVHAVSEVSFQLGQRETLAIVGESGSGKSTTGLAIMGLLAADGSATVSGAVRIASKSGGNKDVLQSERARAAAGSRQRGRNDLPGPDVVAQSDLLDRFADRRSRPATPRRRAPGGHREALRLLAELGIPNPDRILASYPHQLSGGMRQRVMIAIACLAAHAF